MSEHRYLHLDVFTDRPFEGNQLAVFPDGAGLDTLTMQAIAREMAFSETTFVLEPEHSDTDVRMRIFTPAEELPMAGHPTIGSTFALASLGVIPLRQQRFVFGLGVGPTPVDLEWDLSALRFAWMTQRPPVAGVSIEDRHAIATMLHVDPSDVGPTPPQIISCGLPYFLVPLTTRAAVDRAVPDTPATEAFWVTVRERIHPMLFFTQEAGKDGATVYARMFAPAFGIAEDPATGSAAGPLGCYLVQHRLIPADEAGRIVMMQGVHMGRPSRLHIEIGQEGEVITSVRVGGTAVVLGEGMLRL